MLSIRNIVKQYAGHRALDDVSLEVEKGKISQSVLGVPNECTRSHDPLIRF